MSPHGALMENPMCRIGFALCLSCVCGLAPLGAQKIQLSASLSDLESRAKKDSNDAAAHYNVALAYWNAKRWDDVDREMRMAVRLDPQFAPPYLALWALPFAKRPQLLDEVSEDRVPAEWKTAVEESDLMFRRAFLADPLVDLRIVTVVKPARSVWVDLVADIDNFYQWYDDSFENLRQGRFQEAYDSFQRLYNDIDASRHPDRIPLLWLWWHGMAAARANKHDDAVWDFQTLLNRYLSAEEKFKDSTRIVPLRTNEYRYELAIMQQRAGHYNEAISLYREAAQNDAGLFMAHVHLADIYEDHNMMPQAVAERRAAVDANPEDASLELGLGKTLARVGQWADAEKALQQAAGDNPRDARIPYFLGIIEQQLQKPADAKTAFHRFLSLAPSRYAAQIADAKQRLSTLP
jgi:tetratricopeptide (TPR) repeat protein